MEHEFVALLAVAIAVNAAFLSKGFKSSARSATPFDAAVRAKAAQALEAAENSDEELWQRVTEDLCDLGHRTTEASGNMYCLQLQREGRLEWVCV